MRATACAIGLLLLTAGVSAETKPCSARNLPTFEQFKVTSIFSSKPKQPKLRTPVDREYRTIIREAAQRGVNFAGHYSVAVWGCGSGCHNFAVIDLKTGRLFDPKFRDINFHAPTSGIFNDSEPDWFCFPSVINFRKDSDLLVVEGCLDDRQCGRTFYLMGSDGLTQVYYDPDLLPNGKVAER